jgi:hypothetical protein
MSEKLYKPLLIDSVKVTVNVAKHRFIGFNGNYCTAAAKAVGVSDVETDAGQFAPVAVTGILLVEAGGTFAAGTAVTSSTVGKAVLANEDDAVNGYAMDAGTAGQIIRIVRGI